MPLKDIVCCGLPGPPVPAILVAVLVLDANFYPAPAPIFVEIVIAVAMVLAAVPIAVPPIPVAVAVHSRVSADRAIVAVTAAHGAVIPIIALSRPPVTADPDILTSVRILFAGFFGLLWAALGLNGDGLRLAGGWGVSGLLGERGRQGGGKYQYRCDCKNTHKLILGFGFHHNVAITGWFRGGLLLFVAASRPPP